MKGNFPIALKETLKWEGGYVNDPLDPGGATNQGITQSTYNFWRRSRGMPIRNISDIAPNERDEIYKSRYWDEIDGDSLPSGVDMLAFDIAVNSGVGKARQWLGQAPKSTTDKILFLDNKRRGFWKSLPIFKRFGAGWTNRENEIISVAMNLVHENANIA
jgi:lysozyme family protein